MAKGLAVKALPTLLVHLVNLALKGSGKEMTLKHPWNITNQRLTQLSALLDELTRGEEGTRKYMDLLLGNSAIKNCINEHLMSEIPNLRYTVTNLENRMDGMNNIRYLGHSHKWSYLFIIEVISVLEASKGVS